MTSVSGHLLALDFGGQYKNWKGCNPVALFDAPVIKYCPENYGNIKVSINWTITLDFVLFSFF